MSTTCSLGIQMASKGIHQRRTSSNKESDSKRGDDREKTEPGLLQGMMPCVLGVAGFSLVLWLLFYLSAQQLVLPGKSYCTRISNPVSLTDDLSTVTDWMTFAQELGVPPEEIEGDNPMQEILRVWTERSGIPCVEKIVKTLNKLNYEQVAEKVAAKFQNEPNL